MVCLKNLQISEYKNKCIALEAEKKETEEKLNKDKDLYNKIAEIEASVIRNYLCIIHYSKISI